MNTKDYTYLLNKPYTVNERQILEIEKILAEFPYLQSARAIQLKGLYNQDSFRYNSELKKTAAYTTDRSVLFDFITSEQFQSVQKHFFEEKEKSVQKIAVNQSEIIVSPAEKPEPLQPVDKLEESIKRTISAVEGDLEIQEPIHEAPEPVSVTAEPVYETPKEKLEIGKPLEFVKDEKHSFQEWLQLSKLAPVKRDEEVKEPEIDEAKSKKLEIIDKFIEANPKISPVKNTPPSPVNIEKSIQEPSYLMTETLARVYLEQKKYSKAIQAYEILILKYPEKSVFFADRISDIKLLQQNNN